MTKTIARSLTEAKARLDNKRAHIEQIPGNDAPLGIDGVDGNPPVSRLLSQADPQTDADALYRIFSQIDTLSTNEVEYQDRHSGELVVSNTRQFMKRLLMGGIVQKLDYLIEAQNKRCDQAESSLAYAARQAQGDVTGDEILRKEQWAERETERLMELVALRRASVLHYAEYVGEPYGKVKGAEPGVAGASARAAARRQALAATA